MARQEVTVFFNKLKLPDPKFETTKVDDQFHCKLSWQGVECSKGALPAQEFLGVASNKKKAAAGAAEKGLAFLEQQAIFKTAKAPPPPELLLDAIRKLMTKEVLRKEPEFEGQLLLSQHFNQGRLPLHLVAQTRPITQWAAKHLPNVPPTSEEYLPQLRRRLAEEGPSRARDGRLDSLDLGDDAVLPEVELLPQKDGQGLGVPEYSVRRIVEYQGRKTLDKSTPFDIVAALLESVRLGEGKQYPCIMISAEDGARIEEVLLDGGGYYWNSLAQLLGVEAAEVASHARGGKSNPEVYLPEDDIPDDMGDKHLLAMLEGHLGELPNKRQKTTEAVPAAASLAGDASQPPLGSGKARLELTEVRQPTFYATTTSRDLNVRATWLLGRPLYGPVLLTYCKLRPSEWRTPVVKWASFPLPMFRGWLGDACPSCGHARGCGMRLVAQLPPGYRNTKGWRGLPPLGLLQQHIRPEMCSSPPAFDCKPRSDDLDATWDCSASLQLLGGSRLEATSQDCPGEDVARQEAGLQLLHDFERLFVAAFKSCLGEEAQGSQHTSEEAGSHQILEQGEGGEPAEGGIVKIDYEVVGLEGVFKDAVVDSGSGRLEWGCHTIIPQAEDLVDLAQLGGTSSCHLQLPPDFHNPFASRTVACRLTIKSDTRARFGGVPQSSVSLFDPPMSEQRHQCMMGLLREHGCRSVLDIGCGDSRLLEHLLLQAQQGGWALEEVAGIDLDGAAVRRGAKRICYRNPGLFDGPKPLNLHSYQADIACQAASQSGSWGGYVGVDAAIFQEVIEHLDPTPLQWLGACLLGALQPRLLLLSTPNFEYNVVMRRLQPAMLPSGLRNSDHRFEWTRKEFQEWCNATAGEHGYQVSFQDLGHAMQEAEALTNPELPAIDQDVGASTQVAVFVRKGEPAARGSGQHSFTPIFDSTTDVQQFSERT